MFLFLFKYVVIRRRSKKTKYEEADVQTSGFKWPFHSYEGTRRPVVYVM